MPQILAFDDAFLLLLVYGYSFDPVTPQTLQHCDEYFPPHVADYA